MQSWKKRCGRVISVITLFVLMPFSTMPHNTNLRALSLHLPIVLQSAPSLTTAPNVLDFGKQVTRRATAVRRITVTNSGGEKVYMNSASLGGDNWQDFAIVEDTCSGRTIEPAQGCFLGLRFTPARTGERHASLTLTLASSDLPTRVDVRGVGINSIDVPPFGH